MSERELFVFWQFNGDNRSFCNQKCPYCYGDEMKGRTRLHYWNGNIRRWEEAFERLNRNIYFVMSYGEAMGSKGFYQCVEMIERHSNWKLCIVTNLSYSPEALIRSRLGQEKRVFITGTWHPLGVLPNKEVGWERFKKHLLMLKEAEIPVHVLYCWYPPQIKLFPEYFKWFDEHDIRVGARRYVGQLGGFNLPFFRRKFAAKCYPKDYTKEEWAYLYASTCPKVTKYGLKLEQPKGKLCTAGKDMILVRCNGDVALCADSENQIFGNIFNKNFKLSPNLAVCPSKICGGDYGMLHLPDEEFGPLPDHLINDTFFSQIEGIPQGSPVPYPKKEEMLRCLKLLS